LDLIFSGNLTLITFFPLIGIVIVLLASAIFDNSLKHLKIGVLVVSVIEFLISIPLFTKFQNSFAGIQFEQQLPWLTDLGVSYHVGIDGISLFLVLLTTFIIPVTILGTWNSIEKNMKVFMILILVLETALIGTFVALDLILFFIFWEAVLIPMYFIIGIWGTERRIYAAIKFFLYTAFGSALMLIAIFYLYYVHKAQFGFASMDIMNLYNVTLPFSGILSPQGLCFLAFLLAFAIKVPMFPFHTWLPDAHVEAPTAGSVILAAVLLKMGTYGFLRFLLPLFPEATVAYVPILSVIAIIGIIYGAMVAFAQKDLKKLVAYSSVSHLGLIMLGIFVLNVQGLDGSIYQMISHGLSTGALFLLVGMIYDRRHTKKINDFGGLAKVMPVFAAFFMLATLASIGLPLLNGFIGEFLILLGVFKSSYIFAAFGATGLILGAVYMLWAYQRVMFGPLNKEQNKALSDLNLREVSLMLPIAVMIILMGVYPKPFLEKIEPSVNKLLSEKFEVAMENKDEQNSFLQYVKFK